MILQKMLLDYSPIQIYAVKSLCTVWCVGKRSNEALEKTRKGKCNEIDIKVTFFTPPIYLWMEL